MGFFGNVGTVPIGETAIVDGVECIWDGYNWMPDSIYEQYIRRRNPRCLPMFMYIYLMENPDGSWETCTKLFQAEYKIINGVEYRGFFSYKRFIKHLIESGSLSLNDDIMAHYDPSYSIYDKDYLQTPDYIPPIIK